MEYDLQIEARFNQRPLSLLKHIFGSAAYRTDPIVREFFKRGIWRDIAIRIALFWIINIAANFTFPFFHLKLLSKKLRA
jgi:hypothetical protein